MKKVFIAVALLFVGLVAKADFVVVESNVTMANFWEKNGREQQKMFEVGNKIVNANKINRRIPFMMDRTPNVANAHAVRFNKVVVISNGLFPYLDNDDELAFIMSHETAHTLDHYEGGSKWIEMNFNSKAYESKADLIGIDLMVKAGYNPIAAITALNKWTPEATYDFGIFTSHPKTSKRVMEMYKYIYKKYPWALESDMVKNITYQNFLNAFEEEIQEYQRAESEKKLKNGEIERL